MGDHLRLLTAVVVGFLAVALLWPDPNRPLLEDLAVLENLDSYRQVDEIEYLRMLEGLFPAKDGEKPSMPRRRPTNRPINGGDVSRR